MPESSEYTPKCILITGGAGFIASHVAQLLHAKYSAYKIVVLDCLDYCASTKNLTNLMSSPRFKFVKGNIKSADLVRHIVVSEGVDTIMHFAAQTHVDHSFGNSTTFTDTNIVGTHTLLEVAWSHKDLIKRFIHVSTDEVYGENESYSEAMDKKHEKVSALDPTNPYAASKAGAEMLVKSYGHSYDLPYIITRGNNVYGPRQFPEKLIPKLVMMLLTSNKKLTVHGAGTSKRSYLHCDDVASAFECILHKGIRKTTYNIGTSEEHTVISIAHKIIKLLKPGVDPESLIEHVRDRVFNDSRYHLDMSSLHSLGWKQTIPFDAGLKQTVDWYKAEGASFWVPARLSSVLVAHPLPPSAGEPAIDAMEEAVAPPQKKRRTGPHFLIFGRTGWIGGMLGEILQKKGFSWEYANSRMQARESLEAEIVQSGCTHVLNAAGLTGRPNVDWCEDHKVETIRVNVVGTLTLADVCQAHGVHMTNFATGCIFHYDDARPMELPRDKNLVAKEESKTFTEEDRANFAGSYYSETKGYVENMLRAYDNVCTLRVRMPIDADVTGNKRNFIYKIAHYDRIVNIPNSMTVLPELLPYAVELALRKRAGIYNFCNPGAISHNQCLELYKEYIDPKCTWKNFTIEEQAQVIRAGRSNNELSPVKLWKEFPEMRPIRDSLVEFVFKPAAAALKAGKNEH